MDSNMAKPRSTTTKSILDNYSGDVLDIPNGKESILDSVMKDHKQKKEIDFRNIQTFEFFKKISIMKFLTIVGF